MKDSFDDILKRRMEEHHFPVDENHRAKMIDLLNASKRRKAFPLWWFGAGVLVLALSAYFLFPNQDDSSDVQDQQDTKPSVVVGSSQSTDGSTESSVDNSQSIVSSQQSPVGSTQSAVNSQQSRHTRSEAVKRDDNPMLRHFDSLLHNLVLPLSAAPASAHPDATAQHASEIVNPKSDASTYLPSSSYDSSATIQNPMLRPAITQPSATAQQPSEYFLVDDEAVNRYIITSKAVGVTILPDDAEIEFSSSGEPIYRVSSETDLLEPLDLSGIIYDTENPVGPLNPQISKQKALYIFAEAGAGMIFASKPNFDSGWKYNFGAGLGYKLSPKIHLTWSAGYMMQHGGFEFERTSTVDFPGFGTRSSFNSLTPENLHFIYSRLGAQYRIHRHIIGVHAGAQWLYGAQGNIVVHTQDQFASADQVTSQYTWLNTDGLRKVQFTGNIAYGYQLAPRISVLAGADFYLSSFTVEDTELTEEGYYWNGKVSSLQPVITINYLLYEPR